ncbi:hypothetical protein HBH53_096940 [Parastagonospora nodorum]|nr:hypothetical protein HBH53_096940 [Parastagonospora nodorum]KAH3993238.1 hypothetical protein HBI10_206320 [Parastagonospora nodorum]KAH4011241.1 hypothetical protein HBI13_202070 [Parastagonospora nodorum]KAH5002145.1 hypothetical protein HBI74_246330 [Parastagonospora nodorum]KAH5092594.1 hypothetical protein HBH72_187800 [Parastagonospora nodorum]
MLAHRVFSGLRTNTKTSIHLPLIPSPFTHLTNYVLKLTYSASIPIKQKDGTFRLAVLIPPRYTRSSTLNDVRDLT